MKADCTLRPGDGPARRRLGEGRRHDHRVQEDPDADGHDDDVRHASTTSTARSRSWCSRRRWPPSRSVIAADAIVLVRGRVDHKEAGKVCIIVQDVERFDPSDAEIEKAKEQVAQHRRRRAERRCTRRVDAARLPAGGDRRPARPVRALSGRRRVRARDAHAHRRAPPASSATATRSPARNARASRRARPPARARAGARPPRLRDPRRGRRPGRDRRGRGRDGPARRRRAACCAGGTPHERLVVEGEIEGSCPAPYSTDPAAVPRRADVVLLAVKAHQTEGAAPGSWRALCGPETVVRRCSRTASSSGRWSRPHARGRDDRPGRRLARDRGDRRPGTCACTTARGGSSAATSRPPTRSRTLLDGAEIVDDFLTQAWRKLGPTPSRA